MMESIAQIFLPYCHMAFKLNYISCEYCMLSEFYWGIFILCLLQNCGGVRMHTYLQCFGTSHSDLFTFSIERLRWLKFNEGTFLFQYSSRNHMVERVPTND
jgi:hypothetical protein